MTTSSNTNAHREGLPVRGTTQNLITSVLLDIWPSAAAIVDFGIDSQKHYEALYYAIREGEITPKGLDGALGDGAALTTLVRQSASNPHKDVEFHTSWDVLFGRGRQQATNKHSLQEILHSESKFESTVERSTNQGIER